MDCWELITDMMFLGMILVRAELGWFELNGLETDGQVEMCLLDRRCSFIDRNKIGLYSASKFLSGFFTSPTPHSNQSKLAQQIPLKKMRVSILVLLLVPTWSIVHFNTHIRKIDLNHNDSLLFSPFSNSKSWVYLFSKTLAHRYRPV